MKPLSTIVECSCGEEFKDCPRDAELSTKCILPGYYFNCPQCHSTHVWPIDRADFSTHTENPESQYIKD